MKTINEKLPAYHFYRKWQFDYITLTNKHHMKTRLIEAKNQKMQWSQLFFFFTALALGSQHSLAAVGERIQIVQ